MSASSALDLGQKARGDSLWLVKTLVVYAGREPVRSTNLKGGHMEAFEAILTRRSTRRLLPQLPDRELVERVLDAGRHAQSGGNSQTTHLIVITSPQILNELAELAHTGNPVTWVEG